MSDCDAGKKIKGWKRHIFVDTLGLMVGLVVHCAGVQDRDGAHAILASIRRSWPWQRHVLADGGYAGETRRAREDRIGSWKIEIARRSEKTDGFEVLPRPLSRFADKPLPGSGWVVERTFAWLGRCRRLAKDWERSIASAEAWAAIAHARMLSRSIARH